MSYDPAVARLTAAGALAKGAEWQEAAAFDTERLAELVRGLSDDPPLYFRQGRQIMSEGQKAVLMYERLRFLTARL